jgi:acyl transferase domain-containing protein/NADPH:quinone reductase-like Zn-dependent oxidoreductase/surfactin synthase thioesterase subunit
MACRFPGGVETPEDFWDVLRNGMDATGEMPRDRMNVDALYDPEPGKAGKMYVRRGGFLRRPLSEFDAAFFGLSPVEVTHLDPQHRLNLETAWEAMESAGIPPASLAGSPTGVFIGAVEDGYNEVSLPDLSDCTAYSALGTAPGTCSGMIAHLFRLSGPCISVETACSSALVAVHLACESLRRKECSLAFAGAANILLRPGMFVSFCHARMLSPDGRCKTFDASADGYGRAEGAGMVLLKRLDDALRDRDNILAVIRGSAVNHGSGRAVTAPSGPAQQAVIRKALRNARVKPSDISYVEAHGTGTPLGDPIELHALKAVFEARRSAPLFVGSAKTNIGHAEVAAGMAGLIKVILSLRNRSIPPHLHLQRINPNIVLDDFNVSIPGELVPWNVDGPRIAGINSFGFQGTNAHVVVEEAPAPEASAEPLLAERPVCVLGLSARSPEALGDLSKSYVRYLEGADRASLQAFCSSVNLGRKHFEHRRFVVCSSLDELRVKLSAIAGSAQPAGAAPVRATGQVVFLFTGQGAQYAGMGRSLYQTMPIFREAFDRCGKILSEERLLPEPLADVIWGAQARLLDETAYTQPALFAVQYALWEMWKSWGLRPLAVMGHSVGEFMAAVAAGVLSWEDALRLVAVRGALMQKLDGESGAMTSVGAGEPAVEEALRHLGVESRVSVAAINGPESVTISGYRDAVDVVTREFETRGARTRRLAVSHAFHSMQMDPVLAEFEKAAGRVILSEPSVRFISTVTGAMARFEELRDTGYWVRQIRQPVRFLDAIRAAHGLKPSAFLEIGPQPVLLGMAQGCFGPQDQESCAWVPSLRRNAGAPAGAQPDDLRLVLDALGTLYAKAGCDVDWKGLERGFPKAEKLSVPTYPFQRRTFWWEKKPAEPLRTPPRRTSRPFLGTPLAVAGINGKVFSTTWCADTPKYLADHVIGGAVVMPATGFLEAGFSALSRVADGTKGLLLKDVGFENVLVLDRERPKEVQICVQKAPDSSFSIGIFSAAPGPGPDEDPQWIRHAGGLGRHVSLDPAALDIAAIHRRMHPAPLSKQQAYEGFAAVGMKYGPAFRGISQLWTGENEALARVETPTIFRRKDAEGHLIHPALLDACLQVVAFAVDGAGGMKDPHLPVRVEQIQLASPLQEGPVWCHAKVRRDTLPGSPIVADVVVCNRAGKEIARLDGFVAAPVARDRLLKVISEQQEQQAEPSRDWVYEFKWKAQVRKNAHPSALAADWILTGESGRIADMLEASLARNGAKVAKAATSEFEDALGRAAATREVRVVAVVPSARDAAAELASCKEVLSLAQAIARFQAGNPSARLVVTLLTRGAQSMEPGIDAAFPEQAAVWGLIRSAALEFPGIRWILLDLDPRPNIAPEAEAADLYAELTCDGDESQVALRGAQRLVARIARAGGEHSEARPLARPELAMGSVGLVFTERGSIDNLRIQATAAPTRLAPGHVHVRVRAAGLNFRDLMNVLGTYPGDPGPMGLECAGDVVAVGEGVTRFQAGDRVVAMAQGCFNGELTAPEILLAPLPSDLSYEDGSTLAVAFLTAHYALNRLARLRKGERVLIHAGAGGVGMAAVQLARVAGAEIFATAGSPRKRALLSGMGVAHVMDSRSLEFHDQVLAVTQGEGVDVVLNSLAGDFIPKSIALLREGGRYLEIGKTGIWTEDQIAAFNPKARGFLIALDTLTADKPFYVGDMLAELAGLVAAGTVKPLPWTAFPIDSARRALRFMGKGRHAGKIVLNRFQAGDEPLCREDGVYLVTGGLGGVGFATARWLAQRQAARNLILVGRSAPGPERLEEIRKLEIETGARVRVKSMDIGERGGVAELLAEIRTDGLPLRGVVHAAGVLDDGLLMEQTGDRLGSVARPKVAGAVHLDELTRGDPLDFFLLYSSMVSLLGNPGQSAYGAANAFLDALAHERRAQGLTALSVNWGPWAEVGMAARMEETLRRRQHQMGVASIPTSTAFGILEDAIRQDEIEIAVLPLQWSAYVKGVLGGTIPPVLEQVFRDGIGAGMADASGMQGANAEALHRKLLGAKTPDERKAVWRDAIRDEIALLLGMDGGGNTIDPSRGILDLGLDSLLGMELIRRFNRRLEGKLLLSPAILFQHGSVDALSDYLNKALSVNADAGPAAAAATPSETEARNPWLPLHKPVAGAKGRLFCFHSAGGGVLQFVGWPALLPDLEVCAVQLPGRWERTHEPAVTNIRATAAELLPHLLPLMSDVPFAFFGFSMGAMLAHEILQLMSAQGLRLPSRLYVASMNAPHVAHTAKRRSAGDFDQLLPRSLEDPQHRAALVRTLEADLKAVEAYVNETVVPMAIPLTVFWGGEDGWCPRELVEPWREHTSAGLDFNALEGGHDVLHLHTTLIVEKIRADRWHRPMPAPRARRAARR